jgi:uncharacterized membrane protein YqiK
MLISGGKQGAKGGRPALTAGGPSPSELPFRVVVGHGAFVLPVFRKASFLTLAMRESNVIEECVTQQGIALLVKAVIAFKVGSDMASISAAAQRFLSNQSQMDELTGQIFAGHLRSIVGSMTVEDIIRERQRLAQQVLEASETEMAHLGLAVDSLQIQSIDDKGSGYIHALSQPHIAAVNQVANVAQAAADQASAKARQESDRNQAEYARQTAIARAQYQAEIDKAQQLAAQAGPLAAAQAQQAVIAEQALVAKRNAELREAQLQAEVIKPAMAEAERIRIQAEAQASATKLSAAAASAEGRIALDQIIINQLPQLVDSIATGFAGSRLTILNGTDGLNSAASGMVAQAFAVLNALRDGLQDSRADEPPITPAPAAPAAPVE